MSFTFLVSSLQPRSNIFYGAELCCISLEWNDHSAPLRLAPHSKIHPLHNFQLLDSGYFQLIKIVEWRFTALVRLLLVSGEDTKK